MTSLATNHFVLQEIIAKSGGIQPLIELMSKASLETKEYATRTLWHLAGNSEVGVVIAQAGGLTPLVELLSCEDEHLQELAAVVIGRLSRSNPIVSLTVAEASRHSSRCFEKGRARRSSRLPPRWPSSGWHRSTGTRSLTRAGSRCSSSCLTARCRARRRLPRAPSRTWPGTRVTRPTMAAHYPKLQQARPTLARGLRRSFARDSVAMGRCASSCARR